MKKKKTPKKNKVDKYEATITIMGRTSKSDGKTVSEAISGLKIGCAKGKAILTIKHDDRVKEKILLSTQVHRLFNLAGLHREIILKQISSLFQGI